MMLRATFVKAAAPSTAQTHTQLACTQHKIPSRPVTASNDKLAALSSGCTTHCSRTEQPQHLP